MRIFFKTVKEMLALAMQWWHGREEKPDAMPLAGQEVLSVILKGFFCKYLDHILFYKKKKAGGQPCQSG